jgi:hypothetical protein
MFTPADAIPTTISVMTANIPMELSAYRLRSSVRASRRKTAFVLLKR